MSRSGRADSLHRGATLRWAQFARSWMIRVKEAFVDPDHKLDEIHLDQSIKHKVKVKVNGDVAAESGDVVTIYQPTGFPLFCASSQLLRGAKYSSIAAGSICRDPVMANSVSGHGLL